MIAWLLALVIGGLAQADPSAPVDEREPVEVFLDAVSADEAGDHAGAVEGYDALLAAGVSTGAVHYNRGNALLRGGALGEAIAAYRTAAALWPRDPDVQANLAFAREAAKDAIAPAAPSPLRQTLAFWHDRTSRAELLWAVTVLNALFWALLALRLYRRDSEWVRWGLPAVALPLVLGAASLGLRTSMPDRVAVVVADEIEVRAGTTSDATVVFALHEGAEAWWREAWDGWVRVELSDGKQGWVPTAAVAIVEVH